jgi:hypothetical protein
MEERPLPSHFRLGGNFTSNFIENGLIVPLYLAAGANSITIGNSSAYAPDFDALVVQANAPSAASTPLQAWRLQYFSTTSNSGNAADTANPAGDGLPNLLKYALGLDPLIPATNPVSYDVETGYLRLLAPLNPNATDITCSVQVSRNLVNWTTSGLIVEQNNETLLRVQDNTAISGTGSQFMRFQVQDSDVTNAAFATRALSGTAAIQSTGL